MNFTDKRAESYAESHTTAESEVLSRLSRETHLKTYMPRMISGHLQGRILSMISHLLKPSLILEVGTFTGYSALCLAEGLKEGGQLITIDINEELVPMVSSYIREAGMQEKIKMISGHALEVVPALNVRPDLVFIDADKENYPAYWKMIFPLIPSGGILIADNIFWSGKVFDETEKDPETIGIREFTALVSGERNAEQVLLPVRDGLLIIRKK